MFKGLVVVKLSSKQKLAPRYQQLYAALRHGMLYEEQPLTKEQRKLLSRGGGAAILIRQGYIHLK